MVNAPKKNLSPLPARKYLKSTKHSTRRHQQATEAKSGLHAARIGAFGALRNLRSKKKLEVGKQPETHVLSNEEQEKQIEDYVERETAEARKWVEHAEPAIMQQQDHMKNAEKAGLTTTKPEKSFEVMLNAIGDGLGDLARTENGQDGEHDDADEEDPAGGKSSNDDKPGWVMGTISTTVQYRMERFRQMQMKLDEFTHPGWGGAPYYLGEKDTKYGTTALKVAAVVQPQTADDTASSAPMRFGEPMETLDSVPRISQMPQVTSRQRSSHMRRGSRKPQAHERVPSLPPTPMPDWSWTQEPKHVEPVSFNPCISHPQLVSI